MITFLLIVLGAGVAIWGLQKLGVIRASVPFAISPPAILRDFALPLTSKGRREIKSQNHDDHFVYSLGINFTLFIILSFIPVLQLSSFTLSEAAVMGFGLALVYNAVREGIKQHKGGKWPDGRYIIKFSWRDVRYGSYGGCLGFVLAWLILWAV